MSLRLAGVGSARLVCRNVLVVRTISGSYYDNGAVKKVVGFRKPPVPHEELLLQNAGRYPPHLKIDMEHPENWPKHYPPFFESRRPNKYTMMRSVYLGAAIWITCFLIFNPTWLVPWCMDGFSCFRDPNNWVRLEEHPVEEQMYSWQESLVEDPSLEARRDLGYPYVLELEGEKKELIR